MANKEIHYLSDGGTMFWPATTTTAIIDPTSRKTLPEILSKLVSVGDAGNISATVLPPVVLESISINSTSINGINLVGKTYYCPDLSKIRHYYSEQAGQVTPENTDPSSELIYYDKATDKLYRWDSTNQEMISIMLEEPTYLNINLADFDSSNISAFSTMYYLPSSDVLPESTFLEGSDRYKKVILRVRVLNEDNLDGSALDDDDTYCNFSVELIPFTPRNTDDTWNNGAAFLFGSYTYYGTVYSVYVYYNEDDDCSITVEKIQLDKLGTITNMSAYTDMPSYPTVGDDINTAFSKTNRIIQSHEEITARALLNLDGRVQNLTENIGIQEITRSSLKTLRDGRNLTPGNFYRITDYTCTTAQTDTQSAGHVFDIIVLALSESTLSETAWADHHEGDTYFSDCKLEAWELKYCLDNDTIRFSWADSTNGKGVIYYMKDEWDNECPYDFKNIQFKRKLTSGGELDSDNGTDTWVYTFNWWDSTNSVCKDGVIALNGSQYTYLGSTGIMVPIRHNSIKSASEQTLSWTNYNNILNNIVWLLQGNLPQCYAYSFGKNCYDSTFTLGFNNIIGESCFNIISTGTINNNIFSNFCNNISLNSCEGSFFGNGCSRITSLVSSIRNIIIDPGNRFIALNSSQGSTIQNIRIALGVNNTNTLKTIDHVQSGTTQTTYKPIDSVEISV